MTHEFDKIRATQLAHLLRVQKDAALQNLERAKNVSASIENQLSEISHIDRRNGESRNVEWQFSGAGRNWEIWAQVRRIELNRKLAQARVTEAEARRAAAKNFGREQAFQRLIEAKTK